MLITVYVPLAVTFALAVLAPRAARLPAPRAAAWALASVAAVTTVGWTGSLALLAFTGVAQLPQVAAEGRWSVPALQAQNPVHLTVAVVSALVLVAGVCCLVVSAVRQGRYLLRARRVCARAHGGSELIVLDDDVPEAYALPGAPGRIVVSRGMLQSLDGAGRDAMLAHERAHLRGRHHLFQTVWRLAAAVNPLLRPLAEAGRFSLERWADEEAASRVGDRRTVARAVAAAALAASSDTRRAPALAVDGGPVLQRVRALLDPPRRHRRFPLVGCALLLLLCCAGLVDAASDNDAMFDEASLGACAAAPVSAPGHPAHAVCPGHGHPGGGRERLTPRR